LKLFWDLVFWGGQVQRRGVHVNTPKIGSRVGVNCFGGILRFHAELRRESCWGNWDLVFFEVMGGYPRGATEEGGHSCVTLCDLGEFKC
jgi:hypothetical protein